MNIKALLCLAILSLFVCSDARAELPHTFQAGQTAKASEVNENFQYVNKTNFVLKSNGTIVGDVISIGYDYAEVINGKGFRVKVTNSGNVALKYPDDIVFTGTNCSGTAYMKKPLLKTVFLFGIRMNLFYVLPTQNATTSMVWYKSYIDAVNGYCTNSDELGTQDAMVVPMVNDPAITGVPDSYPGTPLPYSTPITIEVR